MRPAHIPTDGQKIWSILANLRRMRRKILRRRVSDTKKSRLDTLHLCYLHLIYCPPPLNCPEILNDAGEFQKLLLVNSRIEQQFPLNIVFKGL